MATSIGISPCCCRVRPTPTELGPDGFKQRHARIGVVVVIKLASVYSTRSSVGDDVSTYSSERIPTTNDQHDGDINNRHQ